MIKKQSIENLEKIKVIIDKVTERKVGQNKGKKHYIRWKELKRMKREKQQKRIDGRGKKNQTIPEKEEI